MQKFALQVHLKSWDTNYAELLSATDLPSLHHRCTQQSHLFKIVNGLIEFPSVTNVLAFMTLTQQANQSSLFLSREPVLTNLPRDIFNVILSFLYEVCITSFISVNALCISIYLYV